MKNKIAIASAFLAAASFSTAEIVINDFLSFEGFVDMSYSHSDAELGQVRESQNSYAIDQVEISWLFDFDTVTAQIDLQYEDDGIEGGIGGGDYELVEQAFVTYHFDNGGAITAGRFASMLGFEAFEPTGLYQYSTAYTGGAALDHLIDDNDGEPLETSDSNASVIPEYDQGVKFTYETDTTFFGVALVDGSYDSGRLGGDLEEDSGYGVEVAGAYNMDNGVSFFLGGRYDDGEVADTTIYNAYVTFETGAWLFAAELAYADVDEDAANSDEEMLNALIMANFAYSDQASVTGRVSYIDGEEEAAVAMEEGVEFFKYTLAHNYAFTDNLLLVTEVSYVDGELSETGEADTDFDELQAAVELIFTF